MIATTGTAEEVEVDVIERESNRARTTDLLLEIAANGGRLFVSACWRINTISKRSWGRRVKRWEEEKRVGTEGIQQVSVEGEGRGGRRGLSGLLWRSIELVELKLKLEFPFWERVKPATS